MRVSCPGCGNQVSDRAPRCPVGGRVAGPASAASGDALVVHPLAAAGLALSFFFPFLLLQRRQKRYPEAVATLDRALDLAPATAERLEAAGRPFEAAQAWLRWKTLFGRPAREPFHGIRGGAR